MTVKDLKQLLEGANEDLPVVICENDEPVRPHVGSSGVIPFSEGGQDKAVFAIMTLNQALVQ